MCTTRTAGSRAGLEQIGRELIAEPTAPDERYFGVDLPGRSVAELQRELGLIRFGLLLAGSVPHLWACARVVLLERELGVRSAR